MSPNERRWWRLVWSGALLGAVLLVAALSARVAVRLDDDPYLLAPPAGPPANLVTAINLFDGVTLQQTVSGPAGFATAVRVGLTNGREAPPEATITLAVSTASGRALATTTQQLGDLQYQEIVLRPLNRHFKADKQYHITLSASGVLAGQDVSVHYKHDNDSVGQLARRFGDGPWHELPGALGVGLLREATPLAVLHSLSASAWLMIGLSGGLLAWLWRPPGRRWLARQLSHRLPLPPAPRLNWRELTWVAVAAGSMAVLLTLPFYTHLDHFSNQDDVHTAVTYRAAARDAVLHGQALPRWDTWQCGGRPLTANVESAHLDPFFWLLIMPFGVDLGTRLSVTATLAVLFLGSYVLTRRCGPADRLPALLAAGVISYSGFVVLGLAQGFFAWIPIGFTPWAVWLALESWRRPRAVVPAGLVTAWLFLGGSIHMTFYTLLMAGLLSGTASLAWRTLVPLTRFGLVGLFTALFAAVKLLPALELHALANSFERPGEWLTPLRHGWALFTDRSFVTPEKISTIIDGVLIGPDQFAFYVGLLPVLIFFASAWWWRRRTQWLFLGPAIVFFLMTFAWPPWTWLAELPLVDEIVRNPQRFRWPLTIMAMMLGAYGLSQYQRRLPRRLGQLALVLLVIVVIADLAMVNGPLLRRVYRFPRPELTRDEQFTMRDQSFSNHPAGHYYRATYFSYLQNNGTKDSCINYLYALPLNARGRNNKDPLAPYHGEVWLAEGGTVTDYIVRPTSWSTSFKTSQPDILVINQNYHLGWRTEPPRPVIRYEGLVAAQVRPGETHLTFHYDPWTVQAGALISFLTLLGSLLYWRSTMKWGKSRHSSAVGSTSVLPSR